MLHQKNSSLPLTNFRRLAVLLVLSLAIAAPVDARPTRSAKTKAEFKLEQPCPSTGKSRGPCPGYVVDHVRPLCAGGADLPSNMQWQTVADAKIKDREERRECRIFRTKRGAHAN